MLNLNIFKERLKEFLNDNKPKIIEDRRGAYTHSSVLLPLFIKDGQYWILLIRRADTLKYHRGEVSFPGGVVDEVDENLESTAKREAFEEVGILGDDIEILGPLDDVSTVTSNFIIHPFIGIVPFPYSFKINRQEVNHLIEIPLQFFLKSSHPKPISIEYKGSAFETPAFEYDGAIIWGATERILENLIAFINSVDLFSH
jgi:8-oxo-dGTP pyrophosphatase MutT (NUDIX family)